MGGSLGLWAQDCVAAEYWGVGIISNGIPKRSPCFVYCNNPRNPVLIIDNPDIRFPTSQRIMAHTSDLPTSLTP